MKNKKLQHIKTPGFTIPDDYFSTFEDTLVDKINTEKHLMHIASSGLKTPKGYFDHLEDRILENLPEEKATKVIPLITKKTIVFISSVAAAVLLLFNLSIFKSNPSFDNLETETVENYIIDDDISTYEIASLMTEEELNENNFVNYNLEENNIEEYLLDNADIEALMIE